MICHENAIQFMIIYNNTKVENNHRYNVAVICLIVLQI